MERDVLRTAWGLGKPNWLQPRIGVLGGQVRRQADVIREPAAGHGMVAHSMAGSVRKMVLRTKDDCRAP